MVEKQDFYAVLGVSKTASVEEIKKAYKKICMVCHPDMLTQRKATDTQKKEAADKFQLSTEAHDVLTDVAKRAAYNQFGHSGVENLKRDGSSTSSNPSSYMPTKKTVHTDESTFDYFERKEEEMRRQRPTSDDGTPRKSAEERAAEAAEARRQVREAARGKPSSPPSPPSVSVTFKDVADKVSGAPDRLKDVTPSLEDLQKLRDSIQSLLKEVDAIISRSPKNGGPRP